MARASCRREEARSSRSGRAVETAIALDRDGAGTAVFRYGIDEFTPDSVSRRMAPDLPQALAWSCHRQPTSRAVPSSRCSIGSCSNTSRRSAPRDAWAEDAPVLAGLAAASVQGLIGLGPQAGARVARYGSPPEDAAPVTRGPGQARIGGSTCTPGSWSEQGGGSARATLSLRLAAADRGDAVAGRRRRTCVDHAAASLGRRHDPSAVRAGRVPGAVSGAGLSSVSPAG